MDIINWELDELKISWEVFKNIQPLAVKFAEQNPTKSYGWVQEKLGPHSINGTKLIIVRI